jgi:hypothetical protein
MDDPHPPMGGSLQDNDSLQIILIHDHPETEEIYPGYFQGLVSRLIGMGVQFEVPAFTSAKEWQNV